MEIKLAGYNFDFEQIKEFSELLEKSTDIQKIKEKFRKIKFTPETIAAAYARISRSKKSVDKLRHEALYEIEKSRKSNQNIVFGMGHSSIAEHAVFNFDIIGISRYLAEFVQRTRLASFTEKSQRYVTLNGDYVLPEEIKNDFKIADEFLQIIKKQNQAYFTLYNGLKKYYNSHNSYKIAQKKLNGKAKEDARYIISLATKTQFGMTINARSVERLLKRLYSLCLREAKELADKIYTQAKSVAPSLIRYIEPTNYDKKRYQTESSLTTCSEKNENKLLSYTENCDEKILTAILFRKTGNSWHTLWNRVKQMPSNEKKSYILKYLKDIESYDSLLREFEIGEFTFQINISASCFAQLKRHRISTIISSDYIPQKSGYTIPESVIKFGGREEFEKVIRQTENYYFKLAEIYPKIKNYLLTNAHNRSVIFKFNSRELCHFSRLRQDIHAQWEIRKIANMIVSECKKVAPISTILICSKDNFDTVYTKTFSEN